MAHQDDGDEKVGPHVSRFQVRGMLLGFMLGSLVALVAAVAVIAVMRRPLPTIAAADVDAAIELWEDAGPASYEMTVEIGGNRPGTVEILVRDGDVVSMTRDGRAPQQQRTWVYWTVPGQFDMILRDFESAKDPARGFGAAQDSSVVLRGRFDRDLGFPLAYERIVLGEQVDVRWEVTDFQALP